VTIPDANLLIYSVNRNSTFHRAALAWLEKTLSSGESLLLPWVVILGFLRITTRAGLHDQPLSVESAFAFVQSWLNHPSVAIAHPGPEHAGILHRLLTQFGAGGNLTTDAHLAALAMEYGAELCSSDNDFARFPGLNWRNPLRPPLK
jgi:toxin-antitoxin system PIN domain toxin